MASSSREEISKKKSLPTELSSLATEMGLLVLISIDGIMEAIEGAHSAWMMQERPINYSVRWGLHCGRLVLRKTIWTNIRR